MKPYKQHVVLMPQAGSQRQSLFVPFNEPMPSIDYEYSPQESIRDITNKCIRDFYEEIEGVMCCCMAAGVSADQVIMSEPKIITDGYNVRMVCGISFEGLK